MYRLNYVLGTDNRVADLVDASELSTLKAAKRVATIIARELASDHLQNGEPVDEGRVEVCDGLGQPVIHIEVRHAIGLLVEPEDKVVEPVKTSSPVRRLTWSRA